jgi:hypothetical protein
MKIMWGIESTHSLRDEDLGRRNTTKPNARWMRFYPLILLNAWLIKKNITSQGYCKLISDELASRSTFHFCRKKKSVVGGGNKSHLFKAIVSKLNA